eukprot:gene12059-14110_t
MNCRLLFALVATLYISAVCSSSAELLFQKKITDAPIVGKDLDISFVIFNVGSGAAYDVSFQDNDFDSTSFEITKGQASGKWETIEAGSNVTQVLTVKPISQKFVPLSATVLSFRKSQSTEDLSYTAAASYSGMYVESVADYDKRTSLHIKEWVIFAVLCLGSVAFPFSIWSYYKMNYVDGVKKQK